MDEAMEWAEYMCTMGLPSVMAHKEIIYRGRNISVSELDALGSDLFYWYPAKSGVTINATEGPREFMSGRRGK